MELKNQTVMIEGVPVETKVKFLSDLPNTLNAQWDSTVMGISITTFYLTLTYRFDLTNGRATKVVDANGAHRNYNPGVIHKSSKKNFGSQSVKSGNKRFNAILSDDKNVDISSLNKNTKITIRGNLSTRKNIVTEWEISEAEIIKNRVIGK